MKVVFGTVSLTPSDVETTAGLTVNGEQVNDTAQFYRALAETFFGRGNRSATIGFSVLRIFDTARIAGRFCFEHLTLLPLQDSLYITVGDDVDNEVVRFDGAVPQAVPITVKGGVSVQVNYSFLCGLPVFNSTPANVVEPSSSMIQRINVPLTAGDTSKVITWPSAFGSLPVVSRPSVEVPDGSDWIDAWVIAGTPSTTGCTVKFNAPIPGSGYSVSLVACA
jgi:hypothetical protein